MRIASRRPPAALALLAALALSSCAGGPGRPDHLGGGPPTAASPGELAQIDDAEQAIHRSESELQAPQAGPAVDCGRACQLQANVCALASKICAIAARYAPDDPVAARCADGRARCRRAREAVAPRCSCGPSP